MAKKARSKTPKSVESLTQEASRWKKSVSFTSLTGRSSGMAIAGQREKMT